MGINKHVNGYAPECKESQYVNGHAPESAMAKGLATPK